jgi:hypothetical protein
MPSKKIKPNSSVDITVYMDALSHPMKPMINELRAIILGVDPNIQEQVKWNSPSFFYTGEMPPFNPKEYKRDICVINLVKKDELRLIFPNGARINDPTGLLEGNFPDTRKMIVIPKDANIKSFQNSLNQIFTLWIATIDKE